MDTSLFQCAFYQLPKKAAEKTTQRHWKHKEKSSEDPPFLRGPIIPYKVQRADLTCDVTSIRFQRFDPWPISNEYSNFAGACAGHVTRFFYKITTLHKWLPLLLPLPDRLRSNFFAQMTTKAVHSPKKSQQRHFYIKGVKIVKIARLSCGGVATLTIHLWSWIRKAELFFSIFCQRNHTIFYA